MKPQGIPEFRRRTRLDSCAFQETLKQISMLIGSARGRHEELVRPRMPHDSWYGESALLRRTATHTFAKRSRCRGLGGCNCERLAVRPTRTAHNQITERRFMITQAGRVSANPFVGRFAESRTHADAIAEFLRADRRAAHRFLALFLIRGDHARNLLHWPLAIFMRDQQRF